MMMFGTDKYHVTRSGIEIRIKTICQVCTFKIIFETRITQIGTKNNFIDRGTAGLGADFGPVNSKSTSSCAGNAPTRPPLARVMAFFFFYLFWEPSLWATCNSALHVTSILAPSLRPLCIPKCSKFKSGMRSISYFSRKLLQWQHGS